MRRVRTSPLAREALLSAAGSAAVAAVLVWLGPPGIDLAAHAYQRTVFLHHGFELWNNFWYAGRYSFVTYSLLYYPLAALLGIKLLAVATVATATLAFVVVIGREWGPIGRWSTRTFAVTWTGIVLSAAFPFALGVALALLALWALQSGARGRFSVLALLALAASPLAFILLAIVLAGIAVARRTRPSDLLAPGLMIALAAGAELVLRRLFPGEGRYPFTAWNLLGVIAFCLIGAAVTWRVERGRILRWMFVLYLFASVVVFLVPSDIGSNIMRLRHAAIPVTVLALSLRRWRPLPVCLGVLAFAVAWSIPVMVMQAVRSSSDPAAHASYWAPAVRYLRAHLTPSYRVEVVDTAGHWAAVYLPRAGIPLVRGWFRQDDYPLNEVLYDSFDASSYRRWLRSMGVRYVVLPDAPTDYSARREAAIVAGGRSGLRRVLRAPNLSIYELPHPTPLVTGKEGARVLTLTPETARLALPRPGSYRLAVRYSPYWSVPAHACLTAGGDDMIRLSVSRPGDVTLRFQVSGEGALAALAGSEPEPC